MQTEQEQSVSEEINVYEFSYTSPNPEHYWRKREVALVLLGQFAEDIQQFRIRNPSLNLKELATNTLKADIENSGNLQAYLRGRSL